MKAMILAAGRGERMRPLTDHTPKPLLKVGDKPLIEWHLERLARAGYREVVINHAWLGDQLRATLADGQRWGITLRWSAEPLGALETAGGIARALPWLGAAPFLVINGDIWCDWDPEAAQAASERLRQPGKPPTLAWLVLVDNPDHHPQGDFGWNPTTQQICDDSEHRPQLTFSGIGVYHPALFGGVPDDSPTRLAPLLRAAMRRGCVGGTHYQGYWTDVGTPERLEACDRYLRDRGLA